MADTQPPRVFISYSWTSDGHKQWVLELAERLMGDGVDVVLDRWHLHPGHDTFAFMEQMVNDPAVHKVLVVCDQVYAEKANRRSGGVGTETQIISSKVYGEVAQEKFLPLIRERDGDGKPHIPTYMDSRLYIDFSKGDAFDEAYETLLRNLHSAPELKRPALGRPPAHIFNPDAVTTTGGKLQRLREAVDKGRPNVALVLRDYLDNLADALEGFRITGAPEAGVERDDAVVSTIERMRPYRDEFVAFCTLYATGADANASYHDVHAFLERLLELQEPSAAMGSYSKWWFAPHEFCSYEWVLYLVAALISARQYTIATRYMDDGYLLRRGLHGDTRIASIGDFNSYIEILDNVRNARLGFHWYSLTATMIRDAATHPRITFRDLVQADMVLMLRPLLVDAKASAQWRPRLSAFARSAGPQDVFVRATTPAGAQALRDLLGCGTAQDLARRLEAAFHNQSMRRFMDNHSFQLDVDVPRMLNWENLQRLLPTTE